MQQLHAGLFRHGRLIIWLCQCPRHAVYVRKLTAFHQKLRFHFDYMACVFFFNCIIIFMILCVFLACVLSQKSPSSCIYFLSNSVILSFCSHILQGQIRSKIRSKSTDKRSKSKIVMLIAVPPAFFKYVTYKAAALCCLSKLSSIINYHTLSSIFQSIDSKRNN